MSYIFLCIWYEIKSELRIKNSQFISIFRYFDLFKNLYSEDHHLFKRYDMNYFYKICVFMHFDFMNINNHTQ